MNTEVEHKYLVVNDSFVALAAERIDIMQGYLSREAGRTVRVRIAGDRAFITIKGRSTADGAARDEFEYAIPVDDARCLLAMCPPPVISKTRHIVPHDGHRWEVDVFHGDLEPLVIAEIELSDPDERYTLPPFVGKNVTGDPRYYNSRLSAPKK